MSLSDIADIDIILATAGMTQAGFGTPLILGYTATWPGERVRTYESLVEVDVDFATTDPEYLAAAAIFSQEPAPDQIKIGKGILPATMEFKYTVVNVANNTHYKLSVNGTDYDYTSGGAATNDNIVAGIVALLVATKPTGFTGSVGGVAPSTYVKLLADAAGNWCKTKVDDLTKLKVQQVHADPGVATDLGNIVLADDDWYCLLTLFNSEAYMNAAAAWVETQDKVYIGASLDSPIVLDSLGGATDVAADWKTAAYARSSCWYHPDNGEFLDAAVAGMWLPYDPGSETAAFKTLGGVDAVTLTATHKVNLEAKYCNFYHTIAGINMTRHGKVSANEFLDTIRFRDWLKVRMQERIVFALSRSSKIPFTDDGIAVIEAEIRAQLQDGIKAGGLASSPKPTVTVPAAADVSALDKAARLLPDVEFGATLAGAIHKIEVLGRITL